MANGIRTGDPHGFNKGCSSKFCEGSRVRQTPEEGRRTYWLKHYGNNNKDEDNSPKTFDDKNTLKNYFSFFLMDLLNGLVAQMNRVTYCNYFFSLDSNKCLD